MPNPWDNLDPPQPDSGAPDAGVPLARPVALHDVPGPGGAFPAGAHGAGPMRLAGVSRAACALDLVLFVAYTAGFLLILNPGSPQRESPEPAADHRYATVFTTLLTGGLWLLIVGLLTRMRGLGMESLGLTRRQLGANLLWGVPITISSFAVYFAVIGGIWVLWPEGFREMTSNPERIASTLPRMHPLAILGMMLCVGLYEETVFRGFVLTRLRRLTESWLLAVPLAAAVFALPHLTMQTVPTALPLFALAVFWSIVVYWRQSLVPVVIGHCLFNTLMLIGMMHNNPEWQ